MNTWRKRICCFVLLGVLLFSFSLAGHGEYVERYHEGIYEYIVQNGSATIISIDVNEKTEIVVPDTLGGSPVTGFTCRFQNCRKAETIVLPTSIRTIPDGAFSHCFELKNVSLHDGIKSIGKQAFYLTALTSISIPATVTTIHADAFGGADQIEKIEVDPENTCYMTDEAGTLYNAGKKALLWVPRNVKFETFHIPASVEVLGDGAFHNTDIKELTGGEGLITFFGFRGNTSLQTVHLTGEKLHTILAATFRDCTALRSVTLPNSVQSIGYEAFKGCTALEEFVAPPNMKTIRYSTFEGCTALRSVALPDGIQTIESGAFMGCTALEKFAVPANTKSIQFHAFRNCTSLKEIVLPEGLESVDTGVFENCESLKSIYIPDSVQGIGSLAMHNCKSLEWISVPADATLYGLAYSTSYSGLVYATDWYPKTIQKIIIRGTKAQFTEGQKRIYKDFDEDAFFNRTAIGKKVLFTITEPIVLNGKDLVLRRGQKTAMLTDIVVPEGDNYTITYISFNTPEVASVDENGIITAHRRGGARINCILEDEYGNTVKHSILVDVKATWWERLIDIFLLGFLWY